MVDLPSAKATPLHGGLVGLQADPKRFQRRSRTRNQVEGHEGPERVKKGSLPEKTVYPFG